MLYFAPMAGRDVSIWGCILGLAANPEGTVPSAPGVGRTRHPMFGAAERRAALLVNVLTWRELANCGRWRLTSGALR